MIGVIVTIIIFLLFITYGLSEHVLIVSLHNIRVFISRMCDGMAKLFAPKGSDTLEWKDSNNPKKQRVGYRSFKDDSYSREKELLNQLHELASEMNLQKTQYEDQLIGYDKELSSLKEQVRDNKRIIENIKSENKRYKETLNGLQPIEKDCIAIPFCYEYEQIISITNRLIGRLVVEFERLPDRQKKLCYPFFVDLVYDRQDEGNSNISRWYILLKDVGLVPQELSYDLMSKNSEDSKLAFLKKYAFETFYRMHIGSAVLFAENIRLSVSTQDRRRIIEESILELIESLRQYGISIDYIPVNTIISDTDYSKYEIESRTNESDEGNKVLLVRKYAVNRSNVYAETEKTVLVINI